MNLSKTVPVPAKTCAGLVRRVFLIVLFIVAGLSLSCTPSREFLLKQNRAVGIDKLYIRVLLKKTDERVLISSNTRMKISELKSGKIIYNGDGKDISFRYDRLSSPVLIESWGSPINVDNEGYRGMLELHNILGKLLVINVLKINEYLYGVVPGEIVHSWNIEALKAQAVAARTYTYHHLVNNKKSLYDLDNSTNFQVYKGMSIETEETNKAVDETTGEIAVFNGKPIVAFFHSTCGGLTADDKYVWEGEGQSYLKPVVCNFCKESPYRSWEEKITIDEIREYLEKEYNGIGRITGISFQRKDNRVISAVIRHSNGVIKMTGNEFRLIFPEKKIKSMFFFASQTSDGLILHGHGWGHGVGMCQWGAKGMAENGANYKDILKFYYKGIRIIDAGQRDYAGK